MILIFAPLLAEFEQRVYDVSRFACEAHASTKGFHAFLHIPDDADRVAAALLLLEVAKPFRSSLLVCQNDDDDCEVAEKVRFVTEELQIRVRVRRFLWVHTLARNQMALIRAFMPGNPMVDPRDVWERL